MVYGTLSSKNNERVILALSYGLEKRVIMAA
jgi:hypothetical protein